MNARYAFQYVVYMVVCVKSVVDIFVKSVVDISGKMTTVTLTRLELTNLAHASRVNKQTNKQTNTQFKPVYNARDRFRYSTLHHTTTSSILKKRQTSKPTATTYNCINTTSCNCICTFLQKSPLPN